MTPRGTPVHRGPVRPSEAREPGFVSSTKRGGSFA
jgi:hypothetical protein